MDDCYTQVIPVNSPPRLSLSLPHSCWRTTNNGWITDRFKPKAVQPPESDQIYPIDWDDVAEFDGPAYELDYDMVWDDGIEGAPSLIFLFFHVLLLVMVSFFLFCFMP